MKTRILLALVPALLVMTGCVVRGRAPIGGDVTFLWTFGGPAGQGFTCEEAGVSTVVISIPGETLDNNGSYACRTNNTAGIVLKAFAGGTYQYTITGYDSHNAALYSATSNFTVSGNTQVSVQVPPAANAANGYVNLHWSFAAALSGTAPICGTDFDRVDMVVDSTAVAAYSCTDGLVSSAAAGIFSPGLPDGTHTVYLRGYNSGAANVDLAQSAPVQVTTAGGTVSDQTFTMGWVVAGVLVSWQPYTGSPGADTATNCASPPATISTAAVNFDVTGSTSPFYSQDVTVNPGCDSSNVTGSAIFFLPVGTYTPVINAAGATRAWRTPAPPLVATAFTVNQAALGHFDAIDTAGIVRLY